MNFSKSALLSSLLIFGGCANTIEVGKYSGLSGRWGEDTADANCETNLHTVSFSKSNAALTFE